MSGKWWDAGAVDLPEWVPATQAQVLSLSRLSRVCDRAIRGGMTDAQRVASRVQGWDVFLRGMSKRAASVLLSRALSIKGRIESGLEEAAQWADL